MVWRFKLKIQRPQQWHCHRDIEPILNVWGDFNALYNIYNIIHNTFWNCNKTNSSVNILFNLMQKCTISVHYPDSPMFYSSESKWLSSTLDIVISNNLQDISTPNTLIDLTFVPPKKWQSENNAPRLQPPHRVDKYAAAKWVTYTIHINYNSSITCIYYNSIANRMQLDNMTHNKKEC